MLLLVILPFLFKLYFVYSSPYPYFKNFIHFMILWKILNSGPLFESFFAFVIIMLESTFFKSCHVDQAKYCFFPLNPLPVFQGTTYYKYHVEKSHISGYQSPLMLILTHTCSLKLILIPSNIMGFIWFHVIKLPGFISSYSSPCAQLWW